MRYIIVFFWGAVLLACSATDAGSGDTDSESDDKKSSADVDGDTDTDTDADTDTDVDSDTDTDTDADSDNDSDTSVDSDSDSVCEEDEERCINGDVYKCQDGVMVFWNECADTQVCLETSGGVAECVCPDTGSDADTDSDTDSDSDTDLTGSVDIVITVQEAPDICNLLVENGILYSGSISHPSVIFCEDIDPSWEYEWSTTCPPGLFDDPNLQYPVLTMSYYNLDVDILLSCSISVIVTDEADNASEATITVYMADEDYLGVIYLDE